MTSSPLQHVALNIIKGLSLPGFRPAPSPDDISSYLATAPFLMSTTLKQSANGTMPFVHIYAPSVQIFAFILQNVGTCDHVANFLQPRYENLSFMQT